MLCISKACNGAIGPHKILFSVSVEWGCACGVGVPGRGVGSVVGWGMERSKMIETPTAVLNLTLHNAHVLNGSK